VQEATGTLIDAMLANSYAQLIAFNLNQKLFD
jgi:hypothetical protein